MKWGLAFLLLVTGALGPARPQATEIQGKWGLGVAVGSLFSSGAEASVIRGASTRTAWIGDFSVSVKSDHENLAEDYRPPYYPDTTIVGKAKDERIAIEVGPRLRRFAAPGNSFSPYGDLYVHFIDTVNRRTSASLAGSDSQLGGKIGIAIGAEYFSTRWPFSIAAHTDVVTFTATHASSDTHLSGRVYRSSGTVLTGGATLRPVVQVRVYW